MSKSGFRALMVWQKSRNLAVEMYKLTREGAIVRDFSLADQIRRSAVSVPSNIADGDERETDKEATRFLYIAKGSLAELMTQLEIAHLVGYISYDQWQAFDGECAQIAKMLGAIIRAKANHL